MSIETDDTQRIGVPPAIVAAPLIASIARVMSPHCNKRNRSRTQFIVLHCTDGHRDDTHPGDGNNTKAEQVAAMLADPKLAKPRSAHYVIDSDSVVQCVETDHRAWAAGRNANDFGVHIELCGLAKQTRAEWLDAVSLPQLQLAARLVSTLCKRYGLPRQFVQAADLARGVQGITTHDEVRLAWSQTTHHDPGPGWPALDFVRAVQLAG